LSDAARPSFRELFGHGAAIHAEAPGRVNLIGEHTDYSDGYVLPTAIPQTTTVELVSRLDSRVRVFSDEIDGLAQPVEYFLGSETKRGDWVDYVAGVTWALERQGWELRGFDARISSDVPLGSGLSSSAALEVSLLRALREAFSLDLDDVSLAVTGRRAENDFVGAPVGIMDQMASSLATEDVALFLDTRTLRYERIRIPGSAELCVVDSGVEHGHATGEYRTRREEVELAAKLLELPALRDASPADLPRVAMLPPPLDRRARHVVTENERVLAAVSALKRADLPELGKLLDASHESLRDDFEVSTGEVDALVRLAREQKGVFGARITGGGFGGSIVVLAARGRARAAGLEVVRRYAAETGREATLLVPASVPAGARR
jgi:galactokinase